MTSSIREVAACLALLGLAACARGNDSQASLSRRPGDSSFVSADGSGPSGALPPGSAVPERGEDGFGEGGERTVEEGDIYRVLSDGTLVQSSSYRGLQIVDVSDPTSPTILGRLPLWGVPVELHVSGSVAHLLLNGQQDPWQGGDALAGSGGGAFVVSVDLSDPTAPREIARQPIPDSAIVTSRLSRSPAGDVLYVAANRSDRSRGTWHATISSFSVSERGIAPIDGMEFPGMAVDIAATPRALLVARGTTNRQQRSTVALVDISRPDGTLAPGAEVEVAGHVASQFNMDLRGNVLRVVSNDGARRTNVLETFDVTDFAAPIPVSNVRFGEGDDLYATLFLDDAAFFVTYFRVDPFHAFSIDENGVAEEKSEYVVSGWNDFFRPVSGATRLIGIGVDDQRGRQMAVSLYDITDLENPEPLIARAHVERSWSHSEANWDHRAYSVVEGAVDVVAADGTRETGLVLLPFSGWSEDGTWQAAVQIFTFSDRTLTRRGILDHGDHVRRSFQTPAATAALSDETLTLFDTSNPDAPEELGRVDLAPNHTDVLVFGDHLVRRVDGTYGWWGYAPPRPTRLEIVPRLGDPSVSRALATLEVPHGSQLRKVGSHLLAVVGDGRVKVYDLQNPEAPRARGEVSIGTTGSSGDGGRRGMAAPDCYVGDCGGWGLGRLDEGSPLVAGEALVFVTRSTETTVVENDPTSERLLVSTRTTVGFELVDLRDPDAPTRSRAWSLPDDEAFVGILADGDRVWLSSKRQEPRGDGRSWARYFTRRITVSPRLDVGPALNVPGQVFAVHGTTLFTKDWLWTGQRLDSGVARLHVDGSRAVLEGYHTAPGVSLEGIFREERGLIVANYVREYTRSDEGPLHGLWILDGEHLRLLATVEIAPWSILLRPTASRAFLQTWQGMYVFNLDDASRPRAQAFFPTLGWPSKVLVEGREALLPGGRYGIHRFDLDEVNLPR